MMIKERGDRGGENRKLLIDSGTTIMTANTTGKLDILLHDCHAVCMNSTEISRGRVE
jgi:hypothetical protein